MFYNHTLLIMIYSYLERGGRQARAREASKRGQRDELYMYIC